MRPGIKRKDSWIRVGGNKTALVWKDKYGLHMLMNMYNPPAEGIFP
jgi:hypothetical protein